MEDVLLYARQHKLAHPPRREDHFLLRETYITSPLYNDVSLANPLGALREFKEVFVLSPETARFLQRICSVAQRSKASCEARYRERQSLYMELPLFRKEPHEGKALVLPTSLASAAAPLPVQQDRVQTVWQAHQQCLQQGQTFLMDTWPLTEDDGRFLEDIVKPKSTFGLALRKEAPPTKTHLLDLPLTARRYPGSAYRAVIRTLAIPKTTTQLDDLEETELRAFLAEPLSEADLADAHLLVSLENKDQIRDRTKLPMLQFELPEVPLIYSTKPATCPDMTKDLLIEGEPSSTDLCGAFDVSSDPYALFPTDELNHAVELLRLPETILQDPSCIEVDRSMLPKTMLDVHRARHARDVGLTVSALPARHFDLQVSWMPFKGTLPDLDRHETWEGEEIATDYLMVPEMEHEPVEAIEMPSRPAEMPTSSTVMQPRSALPHSEPIFLPTSSQSKTNVSSDLNEQISKLEQVQEAKPVLTPHKTGKALASPHRELDAALSPVPEVVLIDPCPVLTSPVRTRPSSISTEDSFDRLVKRRKTNDIDDHKTVTNDPMLSLMMNQADSVIPVLPAPREVESRQQLPRTATTTASTTHQSVKSSCSWILTPACLGNPGLTRKLRRRLPQIHFAERDCPSEEADIITSYASGIVLLSASQLRHNASLQSRLNWLLGRYREVSVLLIWQTTEKPPAIQMAQLSLSLKTLAKDGQTTFCAACQSIDEAVRWIERLGYRSMRTFDLIANLSTEPSPGEQFLARWPAINSMLAALILQATTVLDFILLTREERRMMFGERYSESWLSALHAFCNDAWKKLL